MGSSRIFLGALALFSLFGTALRAQNPSHPLLEPQTPEAYLAAIASSPGKDSVVGLSIFGESLYVWPHRDNLQTAILSRSNGGADSNVESLSWSGTPGLRVGGEYHLPETSWDMGVSFTYFHAKSQRTVSASDGGVLSPVLTMNSAARRADDADGDAGLSYSVLDLAVGRAFSIDDSFRLRLFGGVRLASIDQSLKCVYSGGTLGDGFDFVNSPVRFLGAGLTFGAESDLNVYRGWGFYSKARLGLVVGRFNSVRTETLNSVTINNLNDTFATMVPVAELGVGLGYQGERFFVRVGSELTGWFNMVSGLAPDVGVGATVRRQGSLTLEAVMVKIGFIF